MITQKQREDIQAGMNLLRETIGSVVESQPRNNDDVITNNTAEFALVAVEDFFNVLTEILNQD